MEKQLENVIWLKNTWSLNIIRVFNLLFTHLLPSRIHSFSNMYWAPPVRIIEDIVLLCQWKKKMYLYSWSSNKVRFRGASTLQALPPGLAVRNPPAAQEVQVRSLDQEGPQEKGMATVD